MAQADYVVANGTGAAVRSDLNGQLAAIVSNNSGVTEPSTPYAFQWWADTTTGLLKIRNAANNAFITVGTLADANLGLLSLAGGTLTGALLVDDSGTAALPAIAFDGDTNTGIFSPGADQVAISTNGTQRATVDSSGRLLVGTSSARTYTTGGAGGNHKLQLETAGATSVFTTVGIYSNSDVAALGAFLELGRSKGTSLGAVTAVAQNDILGEIRFAGTDGSGPNNAASIAGYVDGTPGASDMPGRLVFSTTADGAASPTERMRISSNGNILIGKTDPSSVAQGITLSAGGQASFTTNASICATVNRQTDDGVLINMAAQDVVEGTISVSGTTVSYNGGHLSRWSQLLSGVERTEILRGSVLSNLDEMCEWGEEDNEQLNRMKVSIVEGDKNVSGVFQCWDDDDDTYINDFYCAMTGDFVIRIAEGVTVERGNLLMSAGDGTAKPQDDDIIRSKTIAKVTSTNVSCTYDDGSYCVPCVLMAC